ncbi:MAG: ABC transporter ATP-binding protein [Ornithinimicrobium sp.]|uniref:ABC transporter ATP-binding protein n=1 Tax=Ornithinimicrobium sp. TaxID=1977084 RepID=UPI0026DF2CF2|nr:ABC transporter ATP-binding protein [Ornithinimicrobium sp.]MDO5740198.1 ABC transporter ATP-binding protein [Ornithinimicrobium sp.]
MSRLDVSNVFHRYPGSPAPTLRDVSVSVEEEQMVSVIGPSGSGKTTLLRVAAGLEPTLSGAVSFGGVDVADLPTERRDVTVMFQQPLLFDHLDVAGNIGFAPRLGGASRQESRRCARQYLRLVHLEGFDRRSVASLSGGQQQRIALARALAAERSVLLLDEPFSSLDRGLRSSMHDLLAEVRAALAPTILMVTHDIDEAALADSTVILIDGVVHQQGPMPLLYRRPATVGVARLLGGFTEVSGRVRDGIHHSPWGSIPLPSGCDVSNDSVLLLRREDLQLMGPDSIAGVACRAARVVRLRPAGTRQIVSLLTDDHTEVEVEVKMSVDLPIGSRRMVQVPPHAARWAVSLPPPQEETLKARREAQVPAASYRGQQVSALSANWPSLDSSGTDTQ